MTRYMQKKKENPIVMFDIGAVLLELTYGKFKSEFSFHNASPDAIREYAMLEMKDLLGQIPRGEYVRKVKCILDLKDSMQENEVADIIKLCWGKQIDEMVELKERIADKGYAVGLLSNMGLYSKDILQKKHPDIFKTYGGPKIYSYKVGAVKPDDKIYDALSKKYNPVFFIDDKESYLVPAEKFGWTGIYFTPFVDRAEMVRSIAGHTGNTSSSIKIANSVDEVANILISSGLDI